ncbi:YodL domain-containing protein [Anaerotignum sp.]|uniref:YodL domain-containing protein n=1 Tax=Anaerotignum sp. TaxID=2039241 RepID=UPI002898316F|nr:YodL domain-containing protein [Anaerotignum sp.]
MSNIQIKKGCIYYYGNPAGYVKEQNAVVDTMFQREELKELLIEKNLSATWTDGVFERLSRGEKLAELNGENKPLKKVRIWQLKADSDFALRFISLGESQKKFGEPRIENYETVYDGELTTNDLEGIYTKFNIDHPYGYEGHSLSMSDVVELYDDEGSTFHYVDQFGFKEIGFEQPQ